MDRPVVLVVDDEERIRQLLDIALGDLGCEVILASSGGEALELIRQHQIDLVLLDLKMPGKDGYETLRELRDDPQHHSIPVLVVTALLRAPGPQELPAPVAGHLTKPFDLDTLEEAVRTALTRGSRPLA